MKRWPLVAAIFVLIIGGAKTQWVQSAQAGEITQLRDSIAEIKEYNETFRKEYREDQRDISKQLADIARAVKA